MKYLITKEVEAKNLREALKKEKDTEVRRIEEVPQEEESEVGF